MTTDQRIEIARRFRADGYNCAQCMVAAFSDVLTTDMDTAVKAAACLGSGIGGHGEVCGVVTGLAMLTGLQKYNGPSDKAAVYRETDDLCHKFREANGGKITCRDLKSKCGKTCMELIAEGVRLKNLELC